MNEPITALFFLLALVAAIAALTVRDLIAAAAVLSAYGFIGALLYTALGGFVAVVWPDVLQGILIALALIGLPIYCVYLVVSQGQTVSVAIAGDLVLTTPIFRELRKIYPRSRLTLLTSEGFGSVMNNNPHLDRIFKHPRRESWKKLSELIRTLKRERFDLIYDAHCSLRSRWIVWQITAFGLKSKPMVWTIDKRSLKRQLLVRLKINRLNDKDSNKLGNVIQLGDIELVSASEYWRNSTSAVVQIGWEYLGVSVAKI